VLDPPALGVIGPDAGVGKRLELGVPADELGDFGPSGVVQLVEGDLTNDLVADIAPGPQAARPSEDDCHHYHS